MARTRETSVEISETINVLEATTVDLATQDNPSVEIEVTKLNDVSKFWNKIDFVFVSSEVAELGVQDSQLRTHFLTKW